MQFAKNQFGEVGGQSRPALADECKKTWQGLSVAVIGAGLAGLMAARHLCRNGVQVTLIEARDQVGGRVRSNDTYCEGRIIEEGAELIATFHTRWLDLAREYRLGLISRMGADLYPRAGLHEQLTLDKPLSSAEIEAVTADADKVKRKIATLASQIQDPAAPWKNATLRSYDNMTIGDALERMYGVKAGGRLWKYFHYLLVNDEVAPLEDSNFLGLLCKVRAGQLYDPMGYWTELEPYRSADGCQAMAVALASEIPKKRGSSLILKHAVTDIVIAKDRVDVGWKRVLDQRTGKLEAGKAQSQRYDFAILTAPPSVWTNLVIKPAHPKDKIGIIGMGAALKHFTNLTSRFWIGKQQAPLGGSLGLGQVWEGTDNQTRVNNQGIVLSVFAGPTRSDKSGYRTPTESEIVDELTRLYPDHLAHVIKPRLFADWGNTPFIMTGYAAPRKGDIFSIAKQLVEPFFDRMFFAGEHTDMAFFGYMEGALRSGERAAQDLLLQACGKPKAAHPDPPMVALRGTTESDSSEDFTFGPTAELTDFGPRLRKAWHSIIETNFEMNMQEAVDLIGNGLTLTEADARKQLRFFNPNKQPASIKLSDVNVNWRALPTSLGPPSAAVYEALDKPGSSGLRRQDEYCEWHTFRDGAKNILRVVFTSEPPEYYQFLHDPGDASLQKASSELLVRLYQQLCDDKTIKLADLEAAGTYDPGNSWNNEHAVHLQHPANTLTAQINIAAHASILRADSAGALITDVRKLITSCDRFGNEKRQSDPTIGDNVNKLARENRFITLENPVGLYMTSLDTSGWKTPDGTDAQAFWKVLRGRIAKDPGKSMIVRAEFAVPAAKKYTVSDITIGGKAIKFGSQIAENLEMRLGARFGPKGKNLAGGSIAAPTPVRC